MAKVVQRHWNTEASPGWLDATGNPATTKHTCQTS